MKAHRRKRQSILEDYRVNILVSSMVGIVSIIVSTCMFALVVSNIDVNLKIVSLINILCLALGGYVSGYVSAIRRQKKGIVSGLLCGIIVSAILISFSITFVPRLNVFGKVCKLTVVTVCSMLGGIRSANSHIS